MRKVIIKILVILLVLLVVWAAIMVKNGGEVSDIHGYAQLSM